MSLQLLQPPKLSGTQRKADKHRVSEQMRRFTNHLRPVTDAPPKSNLLIGSCWSLRDTAQFFFFVCVCVSIRDHAMQMHAPAVRKLVTGGKKKGDKMDAKPGVTDVWQEVPRVISARFSHRDRFLNKSSPTPAGHLSPSKQTVQRCNKSWHTFTAEFCAWEHNTELESLQEISIIHANYCSLAE